jgi:hypothetical protein
MFDPTLPDLAEPAWRAVRASAADTVRQAAQLGHASARLHGVELHAERLGTPRAVSQVAFVRVSLRRGTAPAEVTFVSTPGTDSGART